MYPNSYNNFNRTRAKPFIMQNDEMICTIDRNRFRQKSLKYDFFGCVLVRLWLLWLSWLCRSQIISTHSPPLSYDTTTLPFCCCTKKNWHNFFPSPLLHQIEQGGGTGNKESGWSDNLQNWPSSSLGHDLTPGNDRHGSVQVNILNTIHLSSLYV